MKRKQAYTGAALALLLVAQPGRAVMVSREISAVAAVAIHAPLKSAQFTATRVDPVERTLRGGPWRVFTTFLSVYQVNGQRVGVAAFWRSVKPGRVIQAKVTKRAGLYWAARINVVTGPKQGAK